MDYVLDKVAEMALIPSIPWPILAVGVVLALVALTGGAARMALWFEEVRMQRPAAMRVAGDDFPLALVDSRDRLGAQMGPVFGPEPVDDRAFIRARTVVDVRNPIHSRAAA